MKTILVPVDFSKISDVVVKEAAALARALHGRVMLLTVIQPPVVMTEYAAMMDLTQITAAGERNAARQLERIEDQLTAEFVTAESTQVSGAPVAQIIAQAERCRADYIVMGSHGHTAFYDLLVGSTTHGVLMRAKCPVVIIPAVKEESPKKRAKARRSMAAVCSAG